MQYNIINNASQNRFELTLDGKTSVIEYKLIDSIISFTHTEVPPELQRNGIASAMAKYAMEYARLNNLKVLPLCPFIKAYIGRNQEYKPLLLEHKYL